MAISTLSVILIWWIAAILTDNSIKIPTPTEVLKALGEILSDPNFLNQVLNTLRRAVLGFLVAFFFGVVLGIGAGILAPLYHFLRPVVVAQRSVPTMAVILLAIIWLGRELAPILVSVLVIFPIIYSAVVNGIREVDGKLLEMAQVYHLSKRRKLMYLYLPSIRSALYAVAAAAISLNLKVIIAAEVLSQPGMGMGTGFQIEKAALNTAGVIAWAVIAIFLGAFLEYLVSPGFLRKFKLHVK